MGSSSYLVAWDAADYDTDSFWSGGSPTRLTIPSGVTKVRLAGGIHLTSDGVAMFTTLSKNGSTAFAGNPIQWVDSALPNGQSITSPALAVTAGDYFHKDAVARRARSPDVKKYGYKME
jgi:hypothetical protein